MLRSAGLNMAYPGSFGFHAGIVVDVVPVVFPVEVVDRSSLLPGKSTGSNVPKRAIIISHMINLPP